MHFLLSFHIIIITNSNQLVGPKEQRYHLDRPIPIEKKLKPWEKGVKMPKHKK